MEPTIKPVELQQQAAWHSSQNAESNSGHFVLAQARQKEQLKKQKFKTTCRNLTIICGIITIIIIWLVLAFNNGKGPA